MKIIGNIVWLLFGGLATAIEYVVSSVALMVTIIGIPFGLQSIKLALLCLWPFGSKVVEKPGKVGCLSTLMNVIWFFIGGIWIWLTHIGFGILLCHGADKLVGLVSLVEQLYGFFPADRDGNHCVRKQHGVAQRQQRQHVGQLLVLQFVAGVYVHHRYDVHAGFFSCKIKLIFHLLSIVLWVCQFVSKYCGRVYRSIIVPK